MEIRLETGDVLLPNRAGAALVTRIVRTLARLATHISRLNLTLKDLNGAWGGRGNVCMLRAELAGGGQVVIIDRDTRMHRAIIGCLRRGKVLIARETARRQRSRRHLTRLTHSVSAG